MIFKEVLSFLLMERDAKIKKKPKKQVFFNYLINQCKYIYIQVTEYEDLRQLFLDWHPP